MKRGGGCNPKKPKAAANFKFGTGFFLTETFNFGDVDTKDEGAF